MCREWDREPGFDWDREPGLKCAPLKAGVKSRKWEIFATTGSLVAIEECN